MLSLLFWWGHGVTQEMTGAGTGLTFSPFSSEAMMGAMNSALDTYRHQKDQWKGIQLRAMNQDMSWQRSAAQYEQVFRWAMMVRRPTCLWGCNIALETQGPLSQDGEPAPPGGRVSFRC